MARRPRVLLDCDGIMIDFITPTLKILHDVTGHLWQHDDVKDWDIMKSLGVSKDIEDEVFGRMKEPGVCLSLPVYQGAIAGVAKLNAICELYVCTSPFGGPYWTHEREQSLLQNFSIDHHHVLHVRDKFVCAGDVLVEDKTSTLVKWREHHTTGLPIRWNTPYNIKDGWDGLDTSVWDVLVGIVIGFAAAHGLDGREGA